MKPPIIGLTGKLESGKSTAARYLRERHGYAGSAITDPMDEMLAPLMRRMGVPENEILPRLNGPMKNAKIPGFPWLTGRKLKQAIGREFRDAISRPLDDGTSSRTFFLELWEAENAHHQYLVNESIRYPFEAAHTQLRGGVVWHINDPNASSEDGHESEQIDFPVDRVVDNPKIGIEHLHAAIDALVGEEPSREAGLAQEADSLTTFDGDIDAALNDHGPEIRALSDALDAGDDDLSETVDDVVSEIKGALGAAAANGVPDAEAETAIAAAETWVTDNVSNSTSDRRVAAVFAFLGAEGARRTLNKGK